MPISLTELVNSIDPTKSALLLGAGASVPSGAPTGTQLAHLLWRNIAKIEPSSDDLIETSTIISRRYTREAVVQEIKKALKPLQPTAGLLGLPSMEWSAIFTTNFDQLVEAAFRRHRKPLFVYRSNFDFSRKEDAQGQKLFKLHGCISEDRSTGHQSSLILTDDDYDDHKSFRGASFAELERTLYQADVLVVGQSLRDRHLQDIIKEVLNARNQGAPGRVFVLAYDRDDLRAQMWEDKGARIAFGGIDEMIHAFAANIPEVTQAPPNQAETLLPASVISAVRTVADERRHPGNVVRMFNGGPATYADIESKSTFERDQQTLVADLLTKGEIRVATIVGAAGVGKTTLARKIAMDLSNAGLSVWEHKNEFNFQYKSWLKIEADLRASGSRGILLLDECTHFMKAINNLLDELREIDNAALQVIVTANLSQWTPRIKSSQFFAKGKIVTLSRLSESELRSLINLLEQNREIANLVQQEFKNESRNRQIDRLRQKCSADMFVCLKNIFANESLDTILLQEYESLAEPLQEYYRFVAALEAVGTRVHRQLILRMLKIGASAVTSVLDGLAGIVDEFDIKPTKGVFGWSTRHLVIARKITDYKFSSVDELTKLFDQIIDNINPLEPIELQSVRAICDMEFGIGRIGDAATRERLYRRLIKLVPGERIPWHRLIRQKLDDREISDTEYVIRDAAESVGADSPIDRYKVRLLVLRSSATPNISDGDRLALLRKAFELAIKNSDRHGDDKYSYREVCNVAIELHRRGENVAYMDEAIARMRKATEKINDPDLDRMLQDFERIRSRMR